MVISRLYTPGHEPPTPCCTQEKGQHATGLQAGSSCLTCSNITWKRSNSPTDGGGDDQEDEDDEDDEDDDDDDEDEDDDDDDDDDDGDVDGDVDGEGQD